MPCNCKRCGKEVFLPWMIDICKDCQKDDKKEKNN